MCIISLRLYVVAEYLEVWSGPEIYIKDRKYCTDWHVFTIAILVINDMNVFTTVKTKLKQDTTLVKQYIWYKEIQSNLNL